MSWWTHIRGTIEVSVPGRTQAEKQYILDTVLSHLPLVDGSEGPMSVHAIRRDGFNCASSHDEFGNRTNLAKDHYGCYNRRHGWYEVQDSYMILVEGDLRDTELEGVKREFMNWLCRLAKRVWVNSVLVNIRDFADSMTINEFGDKFYNMNEEPSWSGSKTSTGEPSWWEYLMWEPDPESGLPMMHVRKYYNDKYVDDEVERREKWRESARV